MTDFPGGANGKEYACQYRRHKVDPWVGKIPWRRKWTVFVNGQYSGMENPMDREAWQATIHRVAKSWTQLKQLSMHMYMTNFLSPTRNIGEGAINSTIKAFISGRTFHISCCNI